MKNKQQEPVVRSASYTTPNHDEVHLIYPHQGNENDLNNGKKTNAFYPAQDYLARQTKYGETIYPTPTPHSL